MSDVDEAAQAIAAAIAKAGETSRTIGSSIEIANRLAETLTSAGIEDRAARTAEAKDNLEGAANLQSQARESLEAAQALIDSLRGGGATSSVTSSEPQPRASSGSPPRQGQVAPKRISPEELEPAPRRNYKRFTKKLPSAAETPVITRITELADGGYQFEAKVPGRVPGSYALYNKKVDIEGNTIGYIKTTILPDGSTAHVKDKLNR